MKTKPMGETETHEFTRAHVCTGEKKRKETQAHTHAHTFSFVRAVYLFCSYF